MSGRRLNEDELERIAARFREGASERTVADEFGISPSSAHSARVRLTEAGRLTQGAGDDSASGEATEASGASVADAQLAELREMESAQLAVCAKQSARLAASESAVQELEAERIRALDEDRDAQDIRIRIRAALDDGHDWATALGRAEAALAGIRQRIAGLEAGQRLADADREHGVLMAEGAELLAGAAGVYRSAAALVGDAARSVAAYRQRLRDAERRLQAASSARASARIAAGLPDDRPVLGGSVNGQPNMNRQAPSLAPACPVVIREGRHFGDPVIALYAAVDRGDLAAIRRALAEADDAAWQAAGPQPAGPVVDGAAVRPAPLANQSLSRSRQDMPGFEAAKPPPWVGNHQANVNVDRAGFTDAPPAGLTRLGQQLAAPAAPIRE